MWGNENDIVGGKVCQYVCVYGETQDTHGPSYKRLGLESEFRKRNLPWSFRQPYRRPQRPILLMLVIGLWGYFPSITALLNPNLVASFTNI